MEDIIGKTDIELFPEEVAKQTYKKDLHVIKTGTPLINKEESAGGVWVLTTKIPWFDKEGNIIGLLGISCDITERKRAEKALRESEHKYGVLFESALDGVVVIDAETVEMVLASKAAAEIGGFDSVEGLLETNLPDFVAPEERERVIRIMAEDMLEDFELHYSPFAANPGHKFSFQRELDSLG